MSDMPLQFDAIDEQVELGNEGLTSGRKITDNQGKSVLIKVQEAEHETTGPIPVDKSKSVANPKNPSIVR